MVNFAVSPSGALPNTNFVIESFKKESVVLAMKKKKKTVKF